MDKAVLERQRRHLGRFQGGFSPTTPGDRKKPSSLRFNAHPTPIHPAGRVAAGSGGIRDGRVLSRVNPATPWCMKRACRRQTTVLSLPRRRVMALVPSREQPPSG